MIQLFKIRNARKELKELLHHAKHVRHMHEDVADPKLIDELIVREQSARNARQGRDMKLMRRAGGGLEKICLKVAPPRKHPKMREWVEVLFVALGAAMAIRAYFFQPFKIPTGSMQPTLYGITMRKQTEDESTAFPSRLVRLITKGEVFIQYDNPIDRFAKKMFIGKPYTIRSTADGTIQTRHLANGEIKLVLRDNFNPAMATIFVGNTPQSVPKALIQHCRFGEQIRKGEPLLTGVAKAGDYILVNRMKYNFMRPKRGDIVVFDARDVTRDAYYIKRMVGLPNETISINEPYLLVNGEKATDQRFAKIFQDENYAGYKFASSGGAMKPLIANSEDTIILGAKDYLFFGDNTVNSLDGRYFGTVKQKRLLGSAFFVGMPLDRAGLAETSH